MPSINKTCRASGKQFEITEKDQEYYRSIDVPPPTLCPEERQRRRLSFRNERNLYHRKCDLSGKQIISNYSPDKLFKVYEKDLWWSDKWDPISYGRLYDFSKTFFEQFRELQLAVPRINLYSKGGENCAYTNHATYNKNCYMLFNATLCEDVHYTTNYVISCKNCIDCCTIDHCELLYNCFLCEQCYSSVDLVNCNHCRDSMFLYDCRGCESCAMCWGLRNKKYHIENKQYSKEEYEKILKQFDRGSYSNYQKLQDRFKQAVKEQAINRFAIIDQCENCTGDYLSQSKDTFDSFYAIKCRDSRFIYDGMGHTDSYDCYESAFDAERQYECYASNFTKFSYCTMVSQESHNLCYTDYCFNSHDLFGCIALKRKEHCILNKQYSKEEYADLKKRIIAHMKETGEWGEFMPSKYSPFTYNESVAQDFLPLTKEEVLARGLQWKETTGQQVTQPESKYKVPDHIKDVKDDIFDAVLKCEVTGKLYKIIQQELTFYRTVNVPLPRKCFDQRHLERVYWRNPRVSWNRQCMCENADHSSHAGRSCESSFQTSYNPNRPEKVYCEACYQKEIY